jgi:hypothetical protein
MAKRKAVLRVTVEFDDRATSEVLLCGALDDFLRTAPGKLAEPGTPIYAVFGPFEVAVPDWAPNPTVAKPESLCAVRDCGRAGVNATCPYDGSSHGHGRVHYECHKRWVPWTELEFEDLAVGGWRLICREHLDQMNSEIQQEQAQRAESTT